MSEPSPSPSPAPAPSVAPTAAPPAASAPTPPSPAGTAPPSPTPAPQAPARPEYVPENFWDAKSGKVTDDKALATHFNEIFARDAAEQSRRLSLPKDADAYKVELPADFKVPEGVKFEFNATDPLLAQARTMAHELGIGQEGFSRLLSLYAGSQVATAAQVQAARDAEVAKLGSTGPARITAIETFYKAYLGEGDAKAEMSRILTASDVERAEKKIAKITGSGSFTTRGREAPPPQGTRSPEEIARMTPAERLDYARNFDQSKMPAWKDPRAA